MPWKRAWRERDARYTCTGKSGT